MIAAAAREILYKTSKINKKIGTATVYRTLNMLEEIGAINRRNLYKFSEMTEPAEGRVITVMLEDGGKLHLDAAEWNRGVADGSARLWLPERRKGAFCKKCLQNRCNLKKNINKGCYAWLILKKVLLLDRKQQMRRFCMKNHKTWAWLCVFCFFMTMLTGYKRK